MHGTGYFDAPPFIFWTPQVILGAVWAPLSQIIPHICHFLYTGRIFKFQILHLKITRIYPKKSKICIFLRSIWKNLHLTEFFTRAAPVVPVTNMRYGHTVYYKCIISIVVSVTQQQLCITLRISMYVIKR